LKIRHVSTIVFVSDVPRSQAFYRDVLGLTVEQDHGTIVIFEGGFSIHHGPNLLEKTYKRASPLAKGPQGRDNIDIYFESDDLAAAFQAVAGSGAEVIHPIETQEWGQRVFRFHDPDGHIVEIGDPM
jgi:catechol 2,3-dioxygenase-like lactoylglutathione lyase family enzyme